MNNLLKEVEISIDANINAVEEMLRDNKAKLSRIKQSAKKYSPRDEGAIENQEAAVNDLESQLKMAKIIRKGIFLISEREDEKEKSQCNGSNQLIRITKFNLR